ncbi:MAG TPA: hypothetical protein VFG89_08045 [Coriobacteriia bacterium]|nr:hypothetical protein [Coriobacteriia bacterium]
MSAKELELAAEPRVTVDDLRHRAENFKTQAMEEAKSAANAVVAQEATKTILVVAGVVIVAASLAYFLGTRRGRAAIVEQAGL